MCAAALTAWTLLGHRGELLNLATMVGLYTVAVQSNRRRTVGVGAAVVAWSALLGLHVNGWSNAPVAELLWPIAALLLGEVVRSRWELRREYADREARLAAQREQEAADRTRQERLRIAREVHDVVAHTIAAVNVQTGVAAAALDRDPAAARRALNQARQAGRDALAELRSAVALLREEPVQSQPAPRLADLPRLAAQTRAAGLAGVLGNAVVGLVPAGILGALIVVGEYSGGTIRLTLAAVPVRWPVVAAKAVLAGALVFPVALGSHVIGFALAVAVLSSHHPGEPVPAMLGVALVYACGAVLGVALGTAIRSPAGAVTAITGLAPALLAPLLGRAQWLAAITPVGAAQRVLLPVAPLEGPSGWTSVALVALGCLASLAAATCLLLRRDA